MQVVDGIHGLLTTFATDARAAKVPLEKFVITKGLNKAPKDYPDAKGQPHLQVGRLSTAMHAPAHSRTLKPHEKRTTAEAGTS